MSNISGSQRYEYDHVRGRNIVCLFVFYSVKIICLQIQNEPIIKSSRVIKRYIELLYHLQTFYERITGQLYDGNMFSRNKY